MPSFFCFFLLKRNILWRSKIDKAIYIYIYICITVCVFQDGDSSWAIQLVLPIVFLVLLQVTKEMQQRFPRVYRCIRRSMGRYISMPTGIYICTHVQVGTRRFSLLLLYIIYLYFIYSLGLHTVQVYIYIFPSCLCIFSF